jgi:hypothetical protein
MSAGMRVVLNAEEHHSIHPMTLGAFPFLLQMDIPRSCHHLDRDQYTRFSCCVAYNRMQCYMYVRITSYNVLCLL